MLPWTPPLYPGWQTSHVDEYFPARPNIRDAGPFPKSSPSGRLASRLSLCSMPPDTCALYTLIPTEIWGLILRDSLCQRRQAPNFDLACSDRRSGTAVGSELLVEPHALRGQCVGRLERSGAASLSRLQVNEEAVSGCP